MKGLRNNGNEDFLTRKRREIGVSLNEVQAKAVLGTEEAMLLLASPGSGKTTTIIMRIGYLIEERGVDPAHIKAVTFSKASAGDMKERFRRFFPMLPPVDFSTIHSFAFQVLRDHYRRKGVAYRIIEGGQEAGEGEGAQTEADEPPLNKKLILRRLYKAGAGDNITEDQMEALTSYISYVKNKLIPLSSWASVACDVPEAARIAQEYEALKAAGPVRLIDYDDMLTLANEALEADGGLLRSYQRRYDYVLTDESQDTSMVQHALVEKLVAAHGNLCVVADDDQSIYSWRGAEPSYLLDFKSVYPQAATLFMEQNYRSSPEIVGAANRFIKRNRNRYDKNMFTANPPAAPVRITGFADYRSQTKHVVRCLSEVDDLREAAVLFRNNASSITLMNECERAGIPFYMKDADNRFFSHWVVEDVLNFMRMSYTDKRPELLERIHTKMSGYVTKRQMAALAEIAGSESVFDKLLRQVELQAYQVKALEDCKLAFQDMRGMTPLRAIGIIRGRLGYEKAIEKLCERLGFRKDYLIGILNTLEEIADTLATMEDFAKRLKHLEAVMKAARSRGDRNAVTLSTFHSAKGLEFDRVFMVDLIEGIIPASDDIEAAADGNPVPMEEAVRLFYVGMTRARTQLELLTYAERDGAKTTESRFVVHMRNILAPPVVRKEPERATAAGRTRAGGAGRAPIAVPGKSLVPYNPNAIRDERALAAGAVVRHRVFGQGTILERGGDVLQIRFEREKKQLSVHTCLEMGLLEPVQAAAEDR